MSADDSGSVTFQDQPITQLLVKVATRCNIDCSYCYWFRDALHHLRKTLAAEDHGIIDSTPLYRLAFSLPKRLLPG